MFAEKTQLKFLVDVAKANVGNSPMPSEMVAIIMKFEEGGMYREATNAEIEEFVPAFDAMVDNAK